MTYFLEFRDTIRKIYSKNSVFILPVVKFLVAFLTLSTTNSRLGYMSKLDNTALLLIISLMCSFLPSGSIVFFAAIFSLLHMYTLSIEVAIVGFSLYLVLLLLYLRFGPKDTLVLALTPLMFVFKIPYVMPVAMGLVGSPISAISVAFGVVVYYFLSVITGNASNINTMGEEPIAKVRLIIDSFMDNKTMLIMAFAFAVTVLVVYVIRRMAIDFAWTIAIVAGAIINVVLLLTGDLLYDTNMPVLQAVLGSLLAILVGKLIEFFCFCVDYSRIEKVQFEDDEYYYYVKAIPKMTVAKSTKTVKKINAQQVSAAVPTENPNRRPQQRPAGVERERVAPPQGRPQQRPAGNPRTVTTERTGSARDMSQRPGGQRVGERVGGPSRSVTINSNRASQSGDIEDFEELF